LAGYVVGGAVRTASSIFNNKLPGYKITWVELYFLEGVLMLLCGIVMLTCFKPHVIDHRSTEDDDPNSWRSSNTNARSSIWELLKRLLGSIPFLLAVLITAIMSSAVVFALYFITQVCHARGMSESDSVIAVTAIMVLAPGPGMVVGSWLVSRYSHQTPSHPAGGYTDHETTFQVAVVSAAAVIASALVFPISWRVWGSQWKLPFVIGCWGWFFFGGMTGPAMNGVAVSIVSEASHVASGLQFAMANTAKIFLPVIGGYVIDRIGLIAGFNATVVVCSLIFLVLAAIGFVWAGQNESRVNGITQSRWNEDD